VAAAHVFVDDLAEPVLDPDDLHHLIRVLRLRVGESVTAADGRGGWRPCQFTGSAHLDASGDLETRIAASPSLTVAFVLVKGDRPEWTVQKLTELGVDRIMPMVSARSVVRWDEAKAGRNVERLRTIARQAAMQSRQAWIPDVVAVQPFEAVVEVLGPGRAALAQPGGQPPTLAWPAVLVGPEGGWAPEELGCGLATVGLGPSVLRAESAAMAAGVLLSSLRSGLVQPTPAGKNR
jgi:16S rRNA (uracil1498-N3)-methyltransferase